MTDVDEVLAVEREWTEAHQSGDFATIERLMADDYIRLLPEGSLTGKAGVMATLSDEQRAWGFAGGEEYEVRLLGDTAIVIGRWRACGMSSGRRFDDAPRFMSVYVRRQNRCQMLAEQ